MGDLEQQRRKGSKRVVRIAPTMDQLEELLVELACSLARAGPPDDEGVPGWAWVAGGFGVAIVGAGIAVAAATSDCVGTDAPNMSSEIDLVPMDGTEPTVCGQYWTDPSGIFGPMIALHGMPLISLPIAYAIRAALHTDAKQTTFNIGTPAGGGILMQVRGVF